MLRRAASRPIPPTLARRISDRHFGVGGDGLILICPTERADAEMRMFNADGSYSEMCGNGIRCVAKYVYDHGICRRNPLRIESAGRIYTLELNLERGSVASVRVDMGEPILTPAEIPTNLRSPGGPEEPVVDVPITVGGRTFRVTTVSMGNPHCVTFVDEATDDWVLGVGPQARSRSALSEARELRVRRSAQPQASCGSGPGNAARAKRLPAAPARVPCASPACSPAAAIATSSIHLLGGDLSIEWNEENNHVYMTGPAVEVFSGDWPD